MTRSQPNEAFANALLAAARGWHVVPLPVGAKLPPITGWQTLATTDEATIRGWERKKPGRNYGIHLGRSGLLVLDTDGPQGDKALAELEALYGPLPCGLRVKSPKGLHRYFLDPGGIGRKIRWRDELDLLVGEHYLTLPGSIAEAKPYQLLGEASLSEVAVPALPEAWLDALPKSWSSESERGEVADSLRGFTPSCAISPPWDEGDGGDGDDGVTEIFERYPLVAHGTSWKLLFTLARHLRPLFPENKAPPSRVVEHLQRWWERGRQHTNRSWVEVLALFEDAWARVVLGEDAPGFMSEALWAAKSRGCHADVCEAYPRPQDVPVRLLAALAAELQRRAGDEPFFLAQAEAGLVLGLKRDLVGKLLRTFARRQWLALIEPGSYARQRANTYRWLLPDGLVDFSD